MDVIAIIICGLLAIIAAVHLYWAMGGLWPGTDETSLARIVVGEKNITKMPPQLVSLAAALAIFAASLWPLMWRSIIPYFLPQGLVWLGMIVLMLVFIGRGIAGYLPFFKNWAPEQPFARLNALYFSPLCLVVGIGFAALLYNV